MTDGRTYGQTYGRCMQDNNLLELSLESGGIKTGLTDRRFQNIIPLANCCLGYN